MTDSKEAIVAEMRVQADALDALNKEYPTLRESTVALAARTFRKFADRLSRLSGEVENGPGKYDEAMMGLPKCPRLASAQTQEAVLLRCPRCSLGYARMPADDRCHACGATISLVASLTPAAPPAVLSVEESALDRVEQYARCDVDSQPPTHADLHTLCTLVRRLAQPK